MKSKIKYLIFFLISILLLNSCSTLRKIYIGLGGTTFAPPRYEALVYGIVEIEIVDKNGKVIKAKEKIPPLLFKKSVYVVLADKGIKYDGWVEDYPGGIKALRELEKYFKSIKK